MASSPYVDLNAVRDKGSDLCALLSPNERRQIRRAIRLYEAMGELRIERASTKEEALAAYRKASASFYGEFSSYNRS